MHKVVDPEGDGVIHRGTQHFRSQAVEECSNASALVKFPDNLNAGYLVTFGVLNDGLHNIDLCAGIGKMSKVSNPSRASR
jgi:hypothetical protein